MDRQDTILLAELQRDSKQSISALAEHVGVSSSACHRRIQSLEAAGYIVGYGAHLSPSKLGLRLNAMIDVTLASQSRETMERFEAAVQDTPEILDCYLLSGHADYRMRLALFDIDDFNHVHRQRLADLPGVVSLHTAFVLRPIKEWSGYPIKVLEAGQKR